MLQILCWAAAFLLFGVAGIYFYLIGAIPPKTLVDRYRCNQCGKIFRRAVDACDNCNTQYPSSYKEEAPTIPNPIHYILCIGLFIAGVAIIVLSNMQAEAIDTAIPRIKY